METEKPKLTLDDVNAIFKPITTPTVAEWAKLSASARAELQEIAIKGLKLQFEALTILADANKGS